MKLVLDMRGLDEMRAAIRSARARFSSVVEEEALRFGTEAVEDLKTQLWANGFAVAPKARDDGNPPLIDSAKYVNGYIAVVEGKRLSIFSQGMNDNMSNEDLGELLEYGNFPSPPRPHLRPFALQLEGQAGRLAERIFSRLF